LRDIRRQREPMEQLEALAVKLSGCAAEANAGNPAMPAKE